MLLDSLRRDVKVGFRILLKERSFCTLAVVVLALGICGVATMFSVVNGVFLRGFSFPNAPRMVSVTFIDPTTQTNFGVNNQVQAQDFEDFRYTQKSFEKLTAYLNGSTVNVTVNGQPQRYQGAYVCEDFLSILGVAPMMGRDFQAADNKPGAEKTAIIGYGIWQRDFAGASNIVNSVVRVNGKPTTIIGVMPKGFAFPTNEELWIPLYTEFPPKARGDQTAVGPAVMGLIKPDVSLDQATAEMTAVARGFASAYPATNKNFNAGQVQPLIQTFTPAQLRGTLWTMFAFCVGVLLIACVNVMNMQFARATLRAKELAVRSSLGATRLRLIVQMLTESLIVASIGAAVGIGLAYFSIDWLQATVRNLTQPPPSWMSFDMDPIVLVVVVAATVGAAVISGLLPAWMSSRARAAEVLRDGGRGNTSRTVALISRSLVVVQLVVTCLLLVGSLLQVRSIVKQGSIDYGYDTKGLMAARMGLMDGDYPNSDSRLMFYNRLVESLGTVPEFSAVGLTNRFRMVFSGSVPVEIEGKTYATRADRKNANFEQVTSNWFDVMGQQLLMGRAFTTTDMAAMQPIAIVNSAFAQRQFGSENPLGRRFRTTAPDGTQAGPWRTIIGVVSTVRMQPPFNNPNVDDSGYYVPFFAPPAGPTIPAVPVATQFATLVVRPKPGVKVDDLANIIRREVRKADSNLPLYFMGTPASQLEGFVSQNRIIATMFTIFGVVAVVLAAVGIYGVMSFSVNRRTQEFGVRMALGASTQRILSMVLRQGSLQVALGLVVGMGGTFALAALAEAQIQGQLFGISPRDPASYAIVAAVVVLVSFFATFVPARRATRVDPLVAFRSE